MATTNPEVLSPPPLIIHPDPPHEHKTTLILLHGTSTSGPVFAQEILNHSIPLPLPSTNLPTPKTASTTTTLPHHLPSTRLVFPSGSPKPLTVLNLPTSNSWFDIHSFSDRTLNEHLAIPGIRESVGYLVGLIRQELRLLEGDDGGKRLVLGGFSSGCAMGVIVVLSLLFGGWGEGVEIGGFVGMSGWLPFRAQLEDAISSSSSPSEKHARASEFLYGLLSPHISSPTTLTNPKSAITTTNTPLLLLHGTADQKVLPEWCKQMVTVLGENGLGLDVQTKEYEGLGHEFCEREMVDLIGFLRGVWSDLD